MAAASVEIPAALLVGSELACGTGPLRCCRAGGGGARTHITGSIERLIRVIITVALSTRWAEAGLASGHAIAFADAGNGTSPALLDI
jgi:hypothetical protein